MKEKLKLDIQKTLYDMIVGESDPELPKDEYAPEAEQLTEWILGTQSRESLSEESIANQLAVIFSTMFDDTYVGTDFREIAQRINQLI